MRTALVRRSATALIVLAALAATPRRAAAVNVSPAVVVIDARTREGVVTLTNGGDHPEEIELAFQYGSSIADAAGNVRLVLSDSAAPGEPSAVGWVRAFPRRLVLGPGERQLVRILVTPPAGVPAGEYWARLVVSAVPQGQAAAEQVQGPATLRLRIGTRIVAAVHYRVGRLTAGVDVRNAEATRDGENVNLALDLVRQGNAAFIGRLRVRFIGRDGAPVGQTHTETLTLYPAAIRRRFRLPAAPTGAVAVEYTIDTDRPDMPAGLVVRAQPVSGRAALTGGAAPAATDQ
jgi:hypothetical protein